MTISWKAQVSSAVGMICSGGSRNLEKQCYMNLSQFSLLPIDASIPELHASCEEDATITMSPVSGAATGNVQHARNTANLNTKIQFTLKSSSSSEPNV